VNDIWIDGSHLKEMTTVITTQAPIISQDVAVVGFALVALFLILGVQMATGLFFLLNWFLRKG